MDINQRMTENCSVQEAYGEPFQHCWGCGVQNESGLHIRTYPNPENGTCICRVTPPSQYTGGVPKHLFGGMIAMIFDCHGTASAAWFFHQAHGGDSLTPETQIRRFITARLEVDFRQPTPMNQEVQVTAVAEEIGERKVIVRMELTVGEKLCAQARMVAVATKEP